MDKYQVIVGNIGTVYSGDNFTDAKLQFESYVFSSLLSYGRVSGEPVCLMVDGEPKPGFDYAGTLNSNE